MPVCRVLPFMVTLDVYMVPSILSIKSPAVYPYESNSSSSIEHLLLSILKSERFMLNTNSNDITDFQLLFFFMMSFFR